MPVQWLFAWWNAVYTVPLAVVLVLLTITSLVSLAGGALGELGHGDADHDVEVDHDLALDSGAETDVDADADVDLDHDMDLDQDADLDGDGEISPVERAAHVSQNGAAAAAGYGPLVSALVLLGVGRAPLVMLLQILVLLWGVIGLSIHQTIGATGPGVLLWTVPLTLVLCVVGTRGFATVFGKVFRHKETHAVRRNEMVGRVGRVVFPVTTEEGTIHLRDQHGTLHRVRARSAHGKLDSGREVIVISYDPKTNLYQVDDSAQFVERA